MTNAEWQKQVVGLCKKIAVEKDNTEVIKLTRELSELLEAHPWRNSGSKKIA